MEIEAVNNFIKVWVILDLLNNDDDKINVDFIFFGLLCQIYTKSDHF